MQAVGAPGKPYFEFRARDEKVAYLKCDSSSFSLNRLVDIDVVKYRRLNWEWRVEQLPVGADVNTKGKDDKVLQVLLVFEGGNVIKYMWDTVAPVGTEVDEDLPPRVVREVFKRALEGILGKELAKAVGDVKAIKEVVVESGRSKIGFWVGATRDVFDDYERIYKATPPPVKVVRIQTNSQYAKSTGSGSVGPLVFRGVE
jgi:hypothetical protein